MPRIEREYSSFRDPIAGVFYYGDEVYRHVDEVNFGFYQNLLKEDFFRNLMDNGSIVKTETADFSGETEIADEYGAGGFFRHQKIPFISYPFEWSFLMLKEAAKFTLELQKTLLRRNYSLKDATPYNIQFRGPEPVFIDFCSVEPINPNGVWFAYNQFLQMFIYPLMLKVFSDVSQKETLLANLEGIPFDRTYRMLGLKPKLKISFFPHLILPKLLSVGNRKSKRRDAEAALKLKNVKNNQAVQLFVIDRLLKLSDKLGRSMKESAWSDYTQTKSYSSEGDQFKADFISDFFQKESVSSVIDLGANTGEYSFIAEKSGSPVVAIDLDHQCVERLYLKARSENLNILPLWVDIANPSPAIGWNNSERPSFLRRFKADCLMTLALIHHLLVSNRQPLDRIVNLFADMTGKFLITEYVARDDPMFRLLTMNRKESYDFYTLERFRAEFGRRFKILREKPIPGMQRMIFLMEKTG